MRRRSTILWPEAPEACSLQEIEPTRNAAEPFFWEPFITPYVLTEIMTTTATQKTCVRIRAHAMRPAFSPLGLPTRPVCIDGH
jgi:hypothetical protein